MKIEQKHIDQIIKQFSALQRKEDLVGLLSEAKNMLYGQECEPVELKSLNYYANPKICIKRYQSFTVKKKSGEDRKIHAPVKGLKSILRSLNFVLHCLYEPHEAATGFVLNKSIVDNAKKHVGHHYVLNLDLKDFFHSFDRNRVKLGFMFEPFNLNGDKEPLAFLLASLCTHPFKIDGEEKTVLPQGSPTSPTITNILCKKLDRRLNGLANRFGLTYTRYADDITFSSPHNIYNDEYFNKELKRIIEEDQKLAINPKKTRLQKSGYRQEVTGLIVNEKVNVRRRYVKQIRMWLYYWEKYGYEKADQIFRGDYIADKLHVKNVNANLDNVIDGKLEFLKMVKGVEDGTYKGLKGRYDELNGDKKNVLTTTLMSKEELPISNGIKPTIKSKNEQAYTFYSRSSDNLETKVLNKSLDDVIEGVEKENTLLDEEQIELTVRPLNTSKPIKLLMGKHIPKGIDVPYSEVFVNRNSDSTKKHNPKKIVKWLRLFTKNNSAIKSSTHLWDEKGLFNTYDDFIKRLKDEFVKYEIFDLQYYSSDLYWNKLYPFLFQKELTKIQKQGKKSFGWGRYKIRIGWQYPDTLKTWCAEYFDGKGELSQLPFSMHLPQELRPNNPIAGKTIVTFENVVNLFKKEIEFRDKDLFIAIKTAIRKELSGYELDDADLNSLKGCSFYTNTEYVKKAIIRIFRMIRSRSESRKVQISFAYSENSNEYNLKITHFNSFSDLALNHPKLILSEDSGDLSILRTTLQSLCDFSIKSRFKNENNSQVFARIEYLYNGVENNDWTPNIEIIQEQIDGFVFNLKFPVI